MLTILLLTLSSLATAFVLPSSTSLSPSHDHELSEKCTFTLFHRQQFSTNYIQLNTITDHANTLTINIASHRPRTAFNSYVRVAEDRAFSVADLLDGDRLTITSNGKSGLRFDVGGLVWTSEDGGAEGRSAWCGAGKRTGGEQSRERMLDCAFPCEQVDDEEMEDGFGGVGDDAQVKIELL